MGCRPRDGRRAPPERARGPSSGSSSSATPTATATSSTSVRPTAGSPTRAGRTAGTGSATGTARSPRPRSPSARCRPTPTAPTWRAPTSPSRRGTKPPTTGSGPRRSAAQGRLQPRLLAGGPGLLRGGPRRRQATDRLDDLEHGPLPVDRDRRRGQGAAGGRGTWCRLRCSPGGACGPSPARTAGYNPISYHCGSVWPHDTAIVAAGLARYGFDGAAQQLIFALLDAAAAQGGRLPELFSGLDRGELTVPVGYPTSCSPQAWAAASPLLCLRTLLRLDPWVPYGKTWLCPNLPEAIGYLRVDGIPLAGLAGDRRGRQRGRRWGPGRGPPRRDRADPRAATPVDRGLSPADRPLTSRARSTPRGGATRRRWWFPRRARAARSCPDRTVRTAGPRSIG